MSPDIVLFRLRRFLLALSGLLFAGVVVELLFADHLKEVVQLIPFVLCGLGLIAASVAVLRPQRQTLLGLRACMGLVTFGSLFGLYEHVANNIAFLLEIHPDATAGDVFAGALGGANPLLAPGILALAAVLAVAATYYHPALSDNGRGQGD